MFNVHFAKRLIASVLLVTAPIIAVSTPASAYSRATIINNTSLTVTGTIHYRACRSDSFTVGPNARVTMSAYRGLCLITSVEAHGSPSHNIKAYYNQGHGTTKSQFTISNIQWNSGFDVAVWPTG